MRRLPPIVLALLAAAIALPGLAGLIAPHVLAHALGQHALGVDALNDARAVGGTRLGVALWLAIAAARPAWRRIGLLSGLVIVGATFVGRVASTAIDGVPGAMLKPTIAELVLIVLAALALRAAPESEAPVRAGALDDAPRTRAPSPHAGTI